MKNQKKLIECLKKTSIIQIACQQADVSRATYYRWLEKDEKFKQEADEAKKEGSDVINDLAESGLIKAIKEGNITAIFYRLNHCHPDYSDKRIYLSINDQKLFKNNINNRNINGIYELLLEKVSRGEISKDIVIQVASVINKIYPHEVASSRQKEISDELKKLANLIDEVRGQNEPENSIDSSSGLP
jgi:DNA-binding transcriptional ArsR family regulator